MAAGNEQKARAWFDDKGWRLPPAELRAGLEERGAALELVVELIDEGGKRRRASESKSPAAPAAGGEQQRKAQPPRAADAGGGQAPPARSRSKPKSPTPAATPAPLAGAIPPQNLEAEEYLLGAILLHDKVVDAVRDIADAGDFYRESHARIYRAALELHDSGVPVDPITLTHELEQRGELDAVGGRVRLHELAAIVPATANAPHYARIVRDTATLRGLVQAGGEIAQLGWGREGDVDSVVGRALEIANEAAARTVRVSARDRFVPGGSFILDGPESLEVVWGDDDEGILWAEGEGMMVVGPQGVGKTTLMQQLALARCGLLGRVLGFSVKPSERRVLYLAADRPAQARRSLNRMVAEHNRDELDRRLVVHPGPPDQMVDDDPRALLRLCEQAGADTLFVDSVKDVCLKVNDDESAGRANLAWQYMIAAGIEVVLGHHQRKDTPENKNPNKLGDVYGNQRLYSGLGSVLLLMGEAGAALVDFKHLKQPSETVGPWKILHDHSRGISTVDAGITIEDALSGNPAGLVADDVARIVLKKPDVNRGEIEKIRSALNRRADNGRVDKLAGEPPLYRLHIPGVP